MAISIRNAFLNLQNKDLYNRENLKIYIFLSVIISILHTSAVLLNLPNLFSIIGLFSFLLIIGAIMKSLNNSLNHKESIFPNYFTEFKDLMIVSLKYSVGAFIICMCYFIMLVLILSIFMFSVKALPDVVENIAFFIIAVVCSTIFAFLYTALIYNYAKTLKFSSLFDFEAAFNFIVKSKGLILLYMVKLFLYYLLLGLIIVPFCALSVFVIGLITAGGIIPSAVNFCIVLLLGLISLLVYIDLTTQLYKEVEEKTEEPEINTNEEPS